MNVAQRAAVSFTDMAAMFSEEEWDILEEAQRSLFRNVMHEIQNVLIRLGLGLDILLRINYLGQGKEVENCDQRVIKAEPDFLPRVHQEEDGDFPDTFPAEGRLLCTPGTGQHSRYVTDAALPLSISLDPRS